MKRKLVTKKNIKMENKKMSKKKILLGAIVAANLAGCAVINRQPISMNERSQINSDRIVLTTHQKRLQAQSTDPSSNIGNLPTPVPGGLIGALIITGVDAAEKDHAESAMQPIAQELSNSEIMNNFKDDLSDQLTQVSWLKISNAKVAYNLNETNVGGVLNQSSENTAFLVNLTYHLNYQLNALKMRAKVVLGQKSPTNSEIFKTLYDNHFVFIYHLPKQVTQRNVAVQTWSQANGQLIKNIIAQGSQAIATQVAEDIKNPNSNLYAGMKSQKTIHFKNDYQQILPGKLIGMNGRFYAIRGSDDTVYIVNKNSLTSHYSWWN